MIDSAPPITLLLFAWVKLNSTFHSSLLTLSGLDWLWRNVFNLSGRDEKYPRLWYFHNSVDISSPDGSYWLPSLFCIPWTAIWNIAQQLERNQNSHYFERDFQQQIVSPFQTRIILSHLFHMICVEHLVVRVGRPVPAVLGVARDALPHCRGREGGGPRPPPGGHHTLVARRNIAILPGNKGLSWGLGDSR